MSPQRLTRPVTIGLAAAAFALPSTAAAQDLRSPDARDGALVTKTAVGDLRSPDSRDAGEGRGTFNAPDVMVVKVREPTPAPVAADGLDWGDAGIGAGALFGLALLGVGAVVVAVHRRGSATPA